MHLGTYAKMGLFCRDKSQVQMEITTFAGLEIENIKKQFILLAIYKLNVEFNMCLWPLFRFGKRLKEEECRDVKWDGPLAITVTQETSASSSSFEHP